MNELIQSWIPIIIIGVISIAAIISIGYWIFVINPMRKEFLEELENE